MSRKYWEQRSAWDMYQFMEDAEETADLITRVYRKASLQLEYAARDIFEKFMTKYGLSETEAWQIIKSIRDKNSIDQLKQELQNRKRDSEIMKQLEAPAYRARLERLQDLMTQVDAVMQQVYQQEKQFDTKLLKQLGEKAYYRSVYNMQKETGLAFGFSHVSRKQIDQALQMKWSGKHFSDRIWQNTQQLADSLKDELLISLITGRTDRETAESIRAQCGGGAKQARRLVRTESCYMAGELTAQSYIDCGIKKYRYVAVLDLRTSEICRKLDGQVFEVKDHQAGKNYPPMHPWCRSTTISIIDKEILRNMKRSAYNPKTGRTEMVPADMTYDEWYQKYVKGNPEAEAQEKAAKNATFDRKQYDRYREILGKDMPKSFAGFQEIKYNEPEKWRFMKLDYQRRNELLQHPELKLPNAENAILPEPKFTKYLFDENSEKGYPKGRAFTDRLGYGMDNWQKLQKALKEGTTQYPAAFKGNEGFGDRYEQKIVLYGLKDTPANVIVAWIKKADGTIKLTSTYIKEAK